jgi:hypothetical protein
MINRIKNINDQTSLTINQKFMTYDGRNSSSGLYIFNPTTEAVDV